MTSISGPDETGKDASGARQSAEGDAAFAGITARDGWNGHPSYTLVHRDLGDSWTVTACSLPSRSMPVRMPLTPEVGRCLTCWPPHRDPATLRGVTRPSTSPGQRQAAERPTGGDA